MSSKFAQLGYHWLVREGFPPMGSTAAKAPEFTAAIRAANSKVSQFTDQQLASWIVGRLNYLTSGFIDGGSFTHDTNEFGYKIKVTDDTKRVVAHGAVVIHENRTYFASVNFALSDFQSMFVELLTAYPDDLAKCEVRIRPPETQQDRCYGWDGYSLL